MNLPAPIVVMKVSSLISASFPKSHHMFITYNTFCHLLLPSLLDASCEGTGGTKYCTIPAAPKLQAPSPPSPAPVFTVPVRVIPALTVPVSENYASNDIPLA